MVEGIQDMQYLCHAENAEESQQGSMHVGVMQNIPRQSLPN